MTITALEVTGSDIDAAESSEHPVLRFYANYLTEFRGIPKDVPLDRYYHSHCRMYNLDRSTIEGSEQIWEWVMKLYSPFPKVTREIITMIIVSNESANTHRIHMELITTLHPGEGKPAIDVPQSFVYTLGKADSGKGTEGLQFKEIRNYYDYSLIEKARSNL